MLEKLRQNLFQNQSRWFLFTPVFFGLGIGVYFSLNYEPSVIALILFFEFILVLLCLLRHHFLCFLFLSAFFVSLLGFVDAKLQSDYQAKHIEHIDDQITYIKGRVIKKDTTRKGKARLWLKDAANFEKSLKGIYKIATASKQHFETDVCVEMVASLKKPSAPVTTNSYQYDREAYFDGVSAIGFALSEVYVVDCKHNLSIFDQTKIFVLKLRERISEKIEKILPKSQAMIADALISGNKSKISNTLYEKYQKAGLAHFLSISGLHMGLVAGFAFFVIRLFLSFIPSIALNFSTKKIAAVFALVFSFIYLLISGAAIPAERAFIMTSLVFVAVLLNRSAISMRTVCFAALVLLAFSPHVLLKPGFQMSFAAVVALVAFYEEYYKKVDFSVFKNSFIGYIGLYFLGVLITTLIATFATLPIVIYHFDKLSPYAVVGNLAAAPLIGFVVMPFVFLSLALMPFGLALIPLHVAGWGIGLLNKITEYIAELPYAGFEIYPIPLTGFVLIIFGGLWLTLWHGRSRFFSIIFIALGMFSFMFIEKPDAFYSKNGDIALKDDLGQMIMVSHTKNSFLKQNWHIQSEDRSNLSNLMCDKEKCIYQNILEFDFKGHIQIGQIKIDPVRDFGGEIYFNKNGFKIKTIRSSIGFRPWNKI